MAYTELEMATPDDEQLFLPDPPRIDYSKALALYQNILANHLSTSTAMVPTT